ncbi:hypothetical protein DW910_16900 [Bacteroides eggerthii]|jgi:hypothetical protein|uniref:hypothetical protein n=1 Tax=Bacteroides eggerthii TaxID=28111 RepID=UPI000E488EB1|nr:hypothetical protein [Bacteroides eggerthii]RHA95285.1 hypothetical protein DW910_16900 [Bacteroides eggerthii]
MFGNLINRILGLETDSPGTGCQNSYVVKKAVPHEPIPEKYQRDIEALRQKYGDAFKTGLCINLTLQEALSIMHRKRKRIDAYSGLVSYLKKEWNITLTITSQKTKTKSL